MLRLRVDLVSWGSSVTTLLVLGAGQRSSDWIARLRTGRGFLRAVDPLGAVEGGNLSVAAVALEYADAGDDISDLSRDLDVDEDAVDHGFVAAPTDSPESIEVRRRELTARGVLSPAASYASYVSPLVVESAPMVVIVPWRRSMLLIPGGALGESGNILTICLFRVDFSPSVSGELERDDDCSSFARRCFTTDIWSKFLIEGL